ncbi:TetR/AcrR family transcriptional regulator [Yinghuangia seranimata]|uniref:TetR/AcrR family transcriptional regulator n=1 Tax=Yinghuangia seranimata TaxID=408067 RepID=UPI00248B6853|nr:TetR/AcrR family transcriptional regulator [Yinghuangia seranimata]MDI2127563.1 helix-turn-helix domain-containing protein [Yinghuangia seranimata]
MARRAKAVSGRVDDDPGTALREHLLDTAERLLRDRPVTALTAREIAREADVSSGVLYNYFADKNELLVTALVRRATRIVAELQADLPEAGSGTVEDNLLAYAHAALGLHRQGLPILAGLLSTPELLHRFLQEVHRQAAAPQQIQAGLIAYLDAERHLGRVGDIDTSAAATLLTGGTAMLTLPAVLHGPTGHEGDHDERLRALVRVLLTGADPGER